MSTTIENIERAQMREGLPGFAAGDQVRVHFQVVEGTRRRTQVFEGVVIRRQGSGLRETFTVRKQSFGVGVERTFPLHSPKIEKLEVTARGEVRRAKLYYLRGRVGKKARVAERRWGADDPVAATAAAATSDALEAGPEGDQAVAEEPKGVTEAAGEASDEDLAGSGETETEAAGETGEAAEEDSSGSAETEAETETEAAGDAADAVEGDSGGSPESEPESGDRPG